MAPVYSSIHLLYYKRYDLLLKTRELKIYEKLIRPPSYPCR
jgi:hypothetical protein